jgi:hypothetical protein
MHSGNILRVDDPRHNGSSYRFIDSDMNGESRLPWLDFSYLDVHTRVERPIKKGGGVLNYEPQGMLASARSYLQTRGHLVSSESTGK